MTKQLKRPPINSTLFFPKEYCSQAGCKASIEAIVCIKYPITSDPICNESDITAMELLHIPPTSSISMKEKLNVVKMINLFLVFILCCLSLSSFFCLFNILPLLQHENANSHPCPYFFCLKN